MSDVATFVLDRLAEVEATALAALDHGEGRWRWAPQLGRVKSALVDERGVWMLEQRGDGPSWMVADHIARHDPARVLRQVAAMRRVVEYWPDPFGQWNADQAEAATKVKLRAIRALTAIWADHPDYREEWAL